MVWASTKLTIWDYIYRDVKTMNFSYKGKNPELLYKKVKELLQDVFGIVPGGFQEKSYSINKTDNGLEFEAEWEAIRQLDDFSYLKVDITIRGFSSGGIGKVSISYRPVLMTEYPQDTFWQQSIFYEILRRMWHTLFYRKKRNEYYELGRELSEKFESELKEYMQKIG